MTTEKEIPFEKAYARLEEILKAMNDSQVSLEDSLKLFEEADGLIRKCNTKLQAAEQKIETLIKGRDGKPAVNEHGELMTKPFAMDGSNSLGSRS